MKPALLISCVAAVLFSCNQQRTYHTNIEGYDVIKNKSYVLRLAKNDTSDTLTDSILKRKAVFIDFLERHGFKRFNATKDSLAFERANGQSELIELPSVENEPNVKERPWQANLIIIFDPQKNPLFINLKKDTTQADNYLK